MARKAGDHRDLPPLTIPRGASQPVEPRGLPQPVDLVLANGGGGGSQSSQSSQRVSRSRTSSINRSSSGRGFGKATVQFSTELTSPVVQSEHVVPLSYLNRELRGSTSSLVSTSSVGWNAQLESPSADQPSSPTVDSVTVSALASASLSQDPSRPPLYPGHPVVNASAPQDDPYAFKETSDDDEEPAEAGKSTERKNSNASFSSTRGRPRATSSKYDFVKIKVFLSDEHYYILSRFLVSRVLTATRVSSSVMHLASDSDLMNVPRRGAKGSCISCQPFLTRASSFASSCRGSTSSR
jgi:hypothetical protein